MDQGFLYSDTLSDPLSTYAGAIPSRLVTAPKYPPVATYPRSFPQDHPVKTSPSRLKSWRVGSRLTGALGVHGEMHGFKVSPTLGGHLHDVLRGTLHLPDRRRG